MLREPWPEEEYTICTAIVPEAVFTVGKLSHQMRLRAWLVRKSTGLRLQTCRSQGYTPAHSDPAIRARPIQRTLPRRAAHLTAYAGTVPHRPSDMRQQPGPTTIGPSCCWGRGHLLARPAQWHNESGGWVSQGGSAQRAASSGAPALLHGNQRGTSAQPFRLELATVY